MSSKTPPKASQGCSRAPQKSTTKPCVAQQCKEALKTAVPKLTIVPLDKQERNEKDLKWSGELDCVRNLSFTTPKNFLAWLESEHFRQYYEQYVEKRNKDAQRNLKPTKYFQIIEDIAKNCDEGIQSFSEQELAYLHGTQRDDWTPVDHVLSLMIRVYNANRSQNQHEFDVGPFHYDLKNERWHRIWNVFLWCSKEKPFENRARIVNRQHHNTPVEKPWYITRKALRGPSRDSRDEGPESDVDEDASALPHLLIWENAPPNNDDHTFDQAPSMHLPPFWSIPNAKDFKAIVTAHFGLRERQQKIKWIQIEAPARAKVRLRLGSCWTDLSRWELEDVHIQIFLTTEPVQGQVEADAINEKIVPISLIDHYELDENGIFSEKIRPLDDEHKQIEDHASLEGSQSFRAAWADHAMQPGSFPMETTEQLESMDSLEDTNQPHVTSAAEEMTGNIATGSSGVKRTQERLDSAPDGIETPTKKAKATKEVAHSGGPLGSFLAEHTRARVSARKLAGALIPLDIAEFDQPVYQNLEFLEQVDQMYDGDEPDQTQRSTTSSNDAEDGDGGEDPDIVNDDSDNSDSQATGSEDDGYADESDSGFDRDDQDEEVDEEDVDDNFVLPNEPEQDDDFDPESDSELVEYEGPTLSIGNVVQNVEEATALQDMHDADVEDLDNDEDAPDAAKIHPHVALAQELESEFQMQYGGDESLAAGEAPVKPKKLLDLRQLEKFLRQRKYPPDPEPEAVRTKTGRQTLQKMLTAQLQVDSDRPYDAVVAKPTQDTLDRATAIANLRLTGKLFKNEEDIDNFWKKFWCFERATLGVNETNIGPNITISRQALSIPGKGHRAPGMTGMIPLAAQITGAAFMLAKETGSLTSAEGMPVYETLHTKGGIIADAAGSGKTFMVACHLQNVNNRIDSGFYQEPSCEGRPVYRPTLVTVPPMCIEQWIKTFRDNAPRLNILVYWGSRNYMNDLWWKTAHISTKDFKDGPENVPERMKYLFDKDQRRAASTVILTTNPTLESRWKVPSGKLPLFHGCFVRCIIDEAHLIKDPSTKIWQLLHAMDFSYRFGLTATPILNSQTDIAGVAGWLYRKEFETEAGAPLDFDVFKPENLGVTDKRILLALDKDRILNHLRKLPPAEVEADEFEVLRRTMPRILSPVQLKRGPGVVLREADGTGELMGKELPPYQTITIDLRMEPAAAPEMKVIMESVLNDYQKRLRQFADSKSKGEGNHFPFPYDLQRILEMSASTPMLKRFMDSLPDNSTLVQGLAMMEKHGLDHRFFVDQTLRHGDGRPRNRLEYLQHMVKFSPKSRELLQLLRKHVIEGEDDRVLIFCNNPPTVIFLLWLLSAAFYKVRIITSSMTKKEKKKVQGEFNDPLSDVDAMITTYRIGATGIDLHLACHICILFEPGTNTNIELQALGRIRRIGQKFAQLLYRLFVEETFNGIQEMKQLEKRMGEMATWGGNDFQEALREIMTLEEGDVLTNEGYFAGIKKLEMLVKGQKTSRANAGTITTFEHTSLAREYREQCRKEGLAV